MNQPSLSPATNNGSHVGGNNSGHGGNPMPMLHDHLSALSATVANHPVAVIAKGLSKLNDQELAELGQSITPRVAALYEKAYGPAILHVLAPLVAGAPRHNTPSTANSQQPTTADDTADHQGDNNAAGESVDEHHSEGYQQGTQLSPAEVAALEEEIRLLMRDPRYWRDHEPAQLARVAQAFEKLYG